MFHESEGFTMTPEETLIICMLNTITDKQLMVKVQENITKGIECTEVRNVIVKLDRAAHLSDVYRQTNRMHASAAQSKSCRACGKKGHMSASCTVLKNKLNCNYCNLKGSHNSNPCLKKAESKQKERKFYRQDEQRGFQERSSSSKERTFGRKSKNWFNFIQRTLF